MAEERSTVQKGDEEEQPESAFFVLLGIFFCSSAVSREQLVSLDGHRTGHWQAWTLPASCQRTAAGEAAGLLREDKASGRKREAETASSQSCPVTWATSSPSKLWPPGHDCVFFMWCLGARKSVPLTFLVTWVVTLHPHPYVANVIFKGCNYQEVSCDFWKF